MNRHHGNVRTNRSGQARSSAPLPPASGGSTGRKPDGLPTGVGEPPSSALTPAGALTARALRIRLVGGEWRVRGRRVEIRPAAIFGELPPPKISSRLLALFQADPALVTRLSFARPLVLVADVDVPIFTIVAGVETLGTALALSEPDLPLTLYGFLLEST